MSVPCEENHYPGSDPNVEVGAVPLAVQEYDLGNPDVKVVKNEVDES